MDTLELEFNNFINDDNPNKKELEEFLNVLKNKREELMANAVKISSFIPQIQNKILSIE